VQSRWVARRLGEPEFLWDRGLRLDPHAPRMARRNSSSSAGG
jgi:hypothetical protein